MGDLYRAAGVDLRYHAALPGLLVGAGLCFTFLGLTFALSAAGDVVAPTTAAASRNDALKSLLDTASMKFITSLAGLSLSIVYALARKAQLRRADAALAGFTHAVQQQLPLKTPAALQAEANELLDRQYAEVQRIGTDFFVNLGSVLERSFDTGLDQHIGPLRSAIETLSSRLADQNQDAVQEMLQAFLARLEGSTGESMRSTTETLDLIGTRLDGLQGAMDAASARMGRAAEEMASRLGRGTEAALTGVTEQMAGVVATLRELAAENERNSRAAGEDMAQRMAQTSAALTDAVRAFQSRMEEGAADGVSRLAAPIEALLVQLRDLATSQHEAGSQSTASLVGAIGRAADSLEVTARKVAETLGGGANDASTRLVAATEAMRDDLKDVLARFGLALTDSGAVLAQGASDGSEALRTAATALGTDIALAATRLRDAGEATSTALRESAETAGSNLREAGRAIIGSSDELGSRLAALGDASNALARQTVVLENILSETTSPLAAASSDMRAAADASRAALEPWRAQVEAMRGAINGLTAASAGIEATQRTTAELVERLSRATDGFKGLDESMARTLRGLAEALADYQLRIRDFVTGMDAGLSKSVGQLAGVVKTLEQTIDEASYTDRHR